MTIFFPAHLVKIKPASPKHSMVSCFSFLPILEFANDSKYRNANSAVTFGILSLKYLTEVHFSKWPRNEILKRSREVKLLSNPVRMLKTCVITCVEWVFNWRETSVLIEIWITSRSIFSGGVSLHRRPFKVAVSSS